MLHGKSGTVAASTAPASISETAKLHNEDIERLALCRMTLAWKEQSTTNSHTNKEINNTARPRIVRELSSYRLNRLCTFHLRKYYKVFILLQVISIGLSLAGGRVAPINSQR